MPNVMSCARMASTYFFCPTVLAVTPGLSLVRLDPVIHQILEHGDALVFDHVQGMRELAIPHHTNPP
jgi:hypothetical protein